MTEFSQMYDRPRSRTSCGRLCPMQMPEMVNMAVLMGEARD